MPSDPQLHPRVVDALASLNRIGTTINRIGPGNASDIAQTLSLIARSAIEVVPDASAVIYTFDPG